jgi:PAS domain S-box-containing protein
MIENDTLLNILNAAIDSDETLLENTVFVSFHRAISDSQHCALMHWEVDEKGAMRCTFAGNSIKNLIGYAPEDVVGKTPAELLAISHPDKLQQIKRNVDRGTIQQKRSFVRHASGKVVDLTGHIWKHNKKYLEIIWLTSETVQV